MERPLKMCLPYASQIVIVYSVGKLKHHPLNGNNECILRSLLQGSSIQVFLFEMKLFCGSTNEVS